MSTSKAGEVEAGPFMRMTIGRSLKAAREHAGLSQGELAKKLKVGKTSVSQSEAGKVDVTESYVRAVLKACGLPADWSATRRRRGKSSTASSRHASRTDDGMARESGPITNARPNPFADQPMLSLALVREARGRTIDEVAEASGMAPAEVKSLEKRKRLDTVSVATLRRYVKGLGAGTEVQIVVVVGERRYVLKA